jgi:hypothetical protein
VLDSSVPLAPRMSSKLETSKLSFVGPGRDHVNVNAPDDG